MPLSHDLQRAEFCEILRRQWASIGYFVLYLRAGQGEESCGTLRVEEAARLADLRDAEPDGQSEIDQQIAGTWTWLTETVIANADAEATTRFRVRGMAPKGATTVLARNITVTPIAAPRPAGAAAAATLLLPSPMTPGEGSSVLIHHYAELGNQYTHFGRLMLGVFESLSGMNIKERDQLMTQLTSSRENLGELAEVVVLQGLEHGRQRAKEQASVADAAAEERAAKALDSLTREVGSTARMVLANRALTPEATRLLEIVSADPEIMNTLNDPDFAALLEHPGQRAELVKLLRLAREAARKDREAAAAATQPPPNPNPAAEAA